MQNAWIWIVIVVILLGGGLLWWQNSQPSGVTNQTPTVGGTTDQTPPSEQATTTATSTSAQSGSQGSVAGASSVTVTYTDSGFSPAKVTIAKGGTVTFVNNSSGDMWIASDPHPEHSGYDGTSRATHCAAGYTGPAPLDECASGSRFTFTFDKAGTWGYHNHDMHSDIGSVVVQ